MSEDVVFRGCVLSLESLRLVVLDEVRSLTPAALGPLYADLVAAVGVASASRLWLEAFSAVDAAET